MKNYFFYFIFLFAICQPDSAIAGNSLDTTFGKKGISVLAIPENWPYSGTYSDFTVLPNGRILLAGGMTWHVEHPFISRLKDNGDQDSTFGNTGIVLLPFYNHEAIKRILPIGNGKFIIAGDQLAQAGFPKFFVGRIDSAGKVDSSFGTNGIASVQFTPYGGGTLISATLQQDGKIVAVGHYSYDTVIVARYNTDGSLDSAFGHSGHTFTSCGTYGDGGTSVALQADGKIAVGGAGYDELTHNYTYWVARYKPNGTLDSTFNSTGIVSIDGGFYAGIYDVAVQPDGRILACGRDGGLNGMVLEVFRFLPNGSLDTTFNHTGNLEWDYDSLGCTGVSMKLLANGQILIGGRGATPATDKNFGLCRINSNGTIDRSFGQSGKIITPIGQNEAGLSKINLLPDNRIIAVGGAESGGYNRPVVACYNANGSTGINAVENLQSDFTAHVYPNPFKREITIVYVQQTGGQLKVRILNSIGQTITDAQLPVAAKKAAASYMVHVPDNAPAGQYWLTIESARQGSSKTFKLIKL